MLSSMAADIRRSAALPGIGQAIQILSLCFFDRLALTVTEACISFASTRGEAPARAMQTKRVIGAVGDHRRLASHVQQNFGDDFRAAALHLVPRNRCLGLLHPLRETLRRD
jgi:hypothetical protein